MKWWSKYRRVWASTVVLLLLLLQFSPVISANAIQPGDPIQPGTAIQPGNPVQPGTSIKPGTSITPGTPIIPGEMIQPGTPISPGTPIQPGTPITPGDGIGGGGSNGSGSNNGSQGNSNSNGSDSSSNNGNESSQNGSNNGSNNGTNTPGQNNNAPNSSSNNNSNGSDTNNPDSSNTNNSNSADSDSGSNNSNDSESNGENGADDEVQPSEFTPPSAYDWYKYLNQDVLSGTLDYMVDNNITTPRELLNELGPNGGSGSHTGLGTQLMWSTIKTLDGSSVIVQTAGDSVDMISNGKEAIDNIRNLYSYTNAVNAARSGLQGTTQLTDGARSALQATHFATSPISKFNVVTSAVSLGFSTVDTVNNIKDITQAKNGTESALAWGSLGQSSGDMLMSSSVLLAASGVGAPVAAGVFVAGAVLWTAGTLTKAWVNRKQIAADIKHGWNETKKAVSNVVDNVKNAAKNTWKSVTSWFG
ncbi:hypothetical protein ACE3MZ_01855 [Paenibacillus sp. WLX1005]|uniref:hypothetical protein n=1 Tax=Paenibacillus sp. WLX1005 TaxID=3243766 RepID=UPI00398420EC